MLNLLHLQAFVAVIDEGGFREAARRLACAQPTVSQHVRKLEAALGVPLVRRGSGGCAPTPHGERLLPFARSLLGTAERACVAVRDPGLVVGASSNIATYLLQPHLRAFAARHPAAGRLRLMVDGNPAIAERLTRGEVDVALMEWWDGRPGFTARTWRQEALVVIVPPDHAWAARSGITRATLLATPLIGGEPGTGTATLLTRTFGAAARDLQVAMALGSTEAVKRAVMAGLGVSLVMAGAVEQETRHGLLRALPLEGEALSKPLHILLPEAMPATAPATLFADFLLAQD